MKGGGLDTACYACCVVLDRLRSRFRDARALSRIATALERIAAAQEEQARLARLARSGSAGFLTGAGDEDSPPGRTYAQSDEEFAAWEAIANREARGEHVDPSEEPLQEG